METYEGNVTIEKDNVKEWEKKLKNVEKITGYLSIHSNAELKADALRSVGGYLSIYSNVELKALKSVGGYLYIHSNAELKADALRSVGGYLYIHSNAELKADALRSVGGDLYIHSNVELKALKSVGGDLSIHSNISNKLAKSLWKNNKQKKWQLSDKAPEFLLKQKGKDITYKIDEINFEKGLFDKVRKDELSAREVFELTNVEQRRIAYELMDKSKMKELDMSILSSKKDNYGNEMKVVEVNAEGVKKPMKYLNVICPSTKREFYIGTDEIDAEKAKAKSFGFDEVEWVKEW